MRSSMALYQLEVADFRRRSANRELVEDGGVLKRLADGRVVKLVDFQGYGKGHVPTKTLLRWAKTNKQARKMGQKLGTVLTCCKVDSSRLTLESVERTELEPYVPVEIEVKNAGYSVNKDLEVTIARQKEYNIIIDNH